MLKKILKGIDAALLGIVALYAILVTIIDLFDVNTQYKIFNEKNYSLIAVLILSLIGIHLILAKVQKEFNHREILGETENIINSLNGVFIKSFENAEEMEKYLSKRYLEAKEEICDLNWKNTISLQNSTLPRKRSQAKIESSIKKISKNILVREVFVFSDKKRVDKLKSRLEWNNSGNSIRYFPSDNDIPRLQFVIIDKKEVIFASSSMPKLCSVTHESIALNFYYYFNQIWESATPLKEGDNIMDEEIKKILSV